MIIVESGNPQATLPAGVRLLRERGMRRGSRNGPVIVAPEPVTLVTCRPEERVLFWPERDANPAFHLCEALWMLAGRDDVEFPAFFVKRMKEFSDDGERLHGAYGHRWRRRFGVDQLGKIIEGLRRNGTCRRQVLQFWSAEADLGRRGKDLPCNVAATFQIGADGELEMTVFQRSGDLVWGVTGANAVHLSMLQEYVAEAVGVTMGRMRQVVVNLHSYLDTFFKVEALGWFSEQELMLIDYPARTYPLGVSEDGTEAFDDECGAFCSWEPMDAFRLPFFREVAVPLRDAYAVYKATAKPHAFDASREILASMADCDWRLAAQEWIDRREERWNAKQ